MLRVRRDDEKGLALRCRHRLETRNLGREAGGAGIQPERRYFEQRGGCQSVDTHVTFPLQKVLSAALIARSAVNGR